jgi:hypothetical protein
MNQLDYFVSKYNNKCVILDTNILLVYLVGCIDVRLISFFKRTSSRFCEDDFEVLNKIFSKFKKFITTPNILTEVSNLGGQLGGGYKIRFFEILSDFINQTPEQYVKSSDIAIDNDFIKFGITDRGVLELSKDDYLIITDDYKLSARCSNSLNYNHLRSTPKN